MQDMIGEFLSTLRNVAESTNRHIHKELIKQCKHLRRVRLPVEILDANLRLHESFPEDALTTPLAFEAIEGPLRTWPECDRNGISTSSGIDLEASRIYWKCEDIFYVSSLRVLVTEDEDIRLFIYHYDIDKTEERSKLLKMISSLTAFADRSDA